MKKSRLLITGMLVAFLLLSVPATKAKLSDEVNLDNNSFSAGCWGDGIVCSPGINGQLMLWLYPNGEKNAVGFKLSGITDVSEINYTISYIHADNGSQVEEQITGTIDNSHGDDFLTQEWFDLGTCSSGGECVFHEGVEEVTCEVKLIGVTETTLSSTISLQ